MGKEKEKEQNNEGESGKRIETGNVVANAAMKEKLTAKDADQNLPRTYPDVVVVVDRPIDPAINPAIGLHTGIVTKAVETRRAINLVTDRRARKGAPSSLMC